MIIVYVLRDRRALPAQTRAIWIVVPISYLVSDPTANINRVFGLGDDPQALVHPPAAEAPVAPASRSSPTPATRDLALAGRPLAGLRRKPRPQVSVS